MKLMTAEVEKALMKNPLYSHDGEGADAKIVVKYFGGSAATWLITEGEKQPDGDWLFFGYATLGLPDPFDEDSLIWEWGYVLLSQLAELRFPPFGLPVERDMYLPKGATVRDEVFMCREYGKVNKRDPSYCKKTGFKPLVNLRRK